MFVFNRLAAPSQPIVEIGSGYRSSIDISLIASAPEPGDQVQSVDQQISFFWRFRMLSIFRRLMKNEKGATAIEYTLIASLIAVAAIAAMTTVGGKVSNVLTNVASAMT